MSSISIAQAKEQYGGGPEEQVLREMARLGDFYRIYKYANDYGDRRAHTDYKRIQDPTEEEALFRSVGSTTLS